MAKKDRAAGKPRRSGRFFREYTAGLRRQDLRRLFDRDAAEAYAVLTRDQPAGKEPKKGLKRLFYRARLLFLGLSYKLSPPRRVLFAAALVFAIFGVAQISFVVNHQHGVDVSLDASPFFSSLSIGCLLFLLALELVDRVRVRDELEVARQLQRELLPQAAPALPGFAFAHSYRTANEVGGDYYDFIPLADGRLVLVAGDASGHGMAAGLLMAIANATLHTAVDIDPRPRPVAAMLNRALCRSGGRRAFMTLFYGLLEPVAGRFDFLCAGHPFPLLRRGDGTVAELGAGGLPWASAPTSTSPRTASPLLPVICSCSTPTACPKRSTPPARPSASTGSPPWSAKAAAPGRSTTGCWRPSTPTSPAARSPTTSVWWWWNGWRGESW